MRKFKRVDETHMYLTVDKVYDVIEYIKRDTYSDLIVISNDKGDVGKYIINSMNGRKIFEEVTAEYRCEIIDGILE